MAWREQLHQVAFQRGEQSRLAVGASFRGVPFHTLDADLAVGRRTVVHEYPQRDVPYVEDLGRRARAFSVEGYVLGEDYLAQRDALWRALEAEGPGELVHPRWGVLWVSVQDAARIKESPRDGGRASFSISFVEAGRNELPNALIDTTVQVADAAEAVDDAAGQAYVDQADVTGPQVLADTQVEAFSKDLEELLSTARDVISTEALAEQVRAISGVAGDLAALVRIPVNLVQSLQSLQMQLVTAIDRPLSALAEFRSIFLGNQRGSTSALAGSTRSRITVNDNARADLQRRTAIAQQARVLALAITDGVVETADQAQALRDTLLDQIDDELENTDPDAATVWALAGLRTALTRDVGARAELLGQRSTFDTQAVMPALVLAHRVYQDAARADELVRRNAVRNPAFVPAGRLEVLL